MVSNHKKKRLETILFGSLQINFLALCPKGGLSCLTGIVLISLVIKCKNELFMCHRKSQSLLPFSCVGLEVIM